MADSDGERGFAANSMLPGGAERQSAPAACPSSTLYSFGYHEQEIENADAARTAGLEKRNAMDVIGCRSVGRKAAIVTRRIDTWLASTE
jgi:hypothetical protein